MASGHAQDKIKTVCPQCQDNEKKCPEFCPENMQQKQYITKLQDKLRTDLGQNWVTLRSVRTKPVYLYTVCPVLKTCPQKVQDYSTLGEKDFERVVNEYHSLAELEGLANRRKILNAPQLPKWNAVQREIIIRRKLQLEALAK